MGFKKGQRNHHKFGRGQIYLLLLTFVSILLSQVSQAETPKELQQGMRRKFIEETPKVDQLNQIFSEGKFYGYLRLHHITSGSPIASSGSALGLKLKYTTASYNNISFASAFYTAQDTGLTDSKNKPAQGLLADNLEGYDTLGEVYIIKQDDHEKIQAGRLDLKSPLTESSVTLIPNLFEGACYQNHLNHNTLLTLGHVSTIQYGTRAATELFLIGDSAYALATGVGEGLERVTGVDQTTTTRGKSQFMPISQAVLGKTSKSTQGLSVVAFNFSNDSNLKAQLWDYYTWGVMNSVYGDLDYTAFKFDQGHNIVLSFQFLNQTSAGEYAGSEIRNRISWYNQSTNKFDPKNLWVQMINSNGDVSSNYLGSRISWNYQDLSISAAMAQNNGSNVINPYGGDPSYTSMIFSRDSLRAHGNSTRLGLSYDFKPLVKGLSVNLDYADFKNDNQFFTTLTGGQTVNLLTQNFETDFVVSYKVASVKGLLVRYIMVTRDNDYRKYEQTHNRLVVNYAF